MSEYEERIKKIEEVYGIHMSVERAIDILTIARVQYSSLGALPEAIDTLIAAYHEQQQEINKLRAYKLDCDATYKTYSKICDYYQDGYKQGYDDAIKDKENGSQTM